MYVYIYIGYMYANGEGIEEENNYNLCMYFYKLGMYVCMYIYKYVCI